MCGPHNFKGKPELNTKEKVRFREEALKLADWMLLGSGPQGRQSICTEGKLGRLVVT